MNGQVTFELKDLSYKELLEVYKEINEFVVYIENVENGIVKENSNKEKENSSKNV